MAVSSARKDNYEKDSSKTVINSELLIFFIVFSCCLVRLARSALSCISMYPCSIREQAIALIQVFLSLPLRRLSPNNFLNLSKSVALCICLIKVALMLPSQCSHMMPVLVLQEKKIMQIYQHQERFCSRQHIQNVLCIVKNVTFHLYSR